MQGIVTGIQANQSVDIEVADNDQEILIFQREVLEQNPEIKKIRLLLHDAVSEDPINLELARSSNVEVKLKSTDVDDGSAPSIPESVFGLCALRDEYISRKGISSFDYKT